MDAWCVTGLVPEGARILIAGKPGTGKSWLALSLALALAQGLPFLGCYQVPLPRRVLFIDEDTTPGGLAAYLRRLGYEEEPPNLEILCGEGARLDEGSAIADAVERSDPDVVILETLRSLAPSMKENDSGSVETVLAALAALQRGRPRAIIFTHHLTKRGRQSDGIEAVRGSSAITAKVDGVFLLHRRTFADGAEGFAVYPKGKRFAAVEPFQVGIRKRPDDRVMLEHRGRPLTEDERAKRTVWEMVQDFTSGVAEGDASVKTLSAQSGDSFGTNRLREILAELEQDGCIEMRRGAHGERFYQAVRPPPGYETEEAEGEDWAAKAARRWAHLLPDQAREKQ